MIFEKRKKNLVWCDDPPEDPVISIFAECLANNDRSHDPLVYHIQTCKKKVIQFRRKTPMSVGHSNVHMYWSVSDSGVYMSVYTSSHTHSGSLRLCDERLKANAEGSTCLTYTGVFTSCIRGMLCLQYSLFFWVTVDFIMNR
jgi:hypothetical protein